MYVDKLLAISIIPDLIVIAVFLDAPVDEDGLSVREHVHLGHDISSNTLKNYGGGKDGQTLSENIHT